MVQEGVVRSANEFVVDKALAIPTTNNEVVADDRMDELVADILRRPRNTKRRCPVILVLFVEGVFRTGVTADELEVTARIECCLDRVATLIDMRLPIQSVQALER